MKDFNPFSAMFQKTYLGTFSLQNNYLLLHRTVLLCSSSLRDEPHIIKIKPLMFNSAIYHRSQTV